MPSSPVVAPNHIIKKPKETNRSPNPYLNAAEGLYFESQIFETTEAKVITKNELRIENQDTVISEASLVNSVYNIQITTPQIREKHKKSIILDKAICFQVLRANFIKT